MVFIGRTRRVVERDESAFEPFRDTLSKHGLSLVRERTTTLQVNVGLLCNLVCRHCHLNAGPGRKEMMDEQTLKDVVAYVKRVPFETIDITGGAPELNPLLISMIEQLAPFARRLLVRSNLSALEEGESEHFIDVFKCHRVVVVASFPSVNQTQTDSQRGSGIFDKIIQALRRLNAAGYGMPGSGLEIDLVSNPTGAFLPPSQAHAEKRFKDHLKRKWGIDFNNLYTFANVPLGRFRQWLRASGNLDKYVQRLVSNFNPCALEGVMCRGLVSVDWDGYLYDCDFNLAKGIPMAGRRTHVSEMEAPPEPGTPIAVADHCYTCTAGAGFT
jgi:radical SAM/Cys-rich protein